jgi:hypothetical protein
MNQQEKTTFEKEFENNNALIDELLLHREIDQAIKKESQVKNFMQSLEKIHTREFEPGKNKIINLQNKWYWAAASITVFSGTAIYTMSRHASSPDNLYNKYYEVWQPAYITRGIEVDAKIEQILANFEQHNYPQTLALIEQLDAMVQISPRIQLINGCALMELNKFDEAIAVFKQFDTENYTLYTETAHWYKALCYVKNSNSQLAKKTLSSIIENDNIYAQEASELLKNLK